MKRHISEPALSLLTAAGLSASDVDDALGELVSDKRAALLRKPHALIQRIGDQTDINVVSIARKSRHILIEIEQRKSDTAWWQYREHSPRRCVFSCRGQLPATIETALNGALLEKLVRPAIAMSSTTIESVGSTRDGWLEVDVTPAWIEF